MAPIALIGGAGNDTLVGGEGDDTYVVNDASDTLIEEATADGGLFDTVESSVTFTLQTNFERLFLQGSDHLNGTGNSADNFISGNSGDNILIGQWLATMYSSVAQAPIRCRAEQVTTAIPSTTSMTWSSILREKAQIQSTTTVSWTLGANTENVNVNSSDSIQINGNSGANLLIPSLGGRPGTTTTVAWA